MGFSVEGKSGAARLFGASLLCIMALDQSSLADADLSGRAKWTNVRESGAACNGYDDDTLAFRRAIASAPVGGVVFVPPGRCVLSDTIIIGGGHPVSIVGSGIGSQILEKSDKTLLSLQNVNAVMVRDLSFVSAATSPNAALVELTNSHHNRIDNVTMLGGYYGLHLKGSLLNTIVDLRTGTNFEVVPASTNKAWVFAEPFNNISANANTFLAPVLEGGGNGIVLMDNAGQGSMNILGGSIEGVTGVALTFQNTFLPSSVSGVHFEKNKIADIVVQAASNIRISSIVSSMPIQLNGDARNVTISDSVAQSVYIDMGDARYPLGSGAKRITLQNITACWTNNKLDIKPLPTLDPDIGMPDGPSSPVIINPQTSSPRKDILYSNIGNLCNGG